MYRNEAIIKLVYKKLIPYGEDLFLHYTEELHSNPRYAERKVRDAVRLSLEKSNNYALREQVEEVTNWVCEELFG